MITRHAIGLVLLSLLGTVATIAGTTGSQFVAVGAGGAILTSPEGLNWTSRVSGTGLRLRAAAASADLLVVVGESGTILTSPDGTTWTPRSGGQGETLRGAAAGPGRFVAVGGYSAAAVVTSADGLNWSVATLPPGGGQLRAVAWGGSQFVAVGAGGTVLTSSDGVTWVAQNAGTFARLDAVMWTGTQFYVLTETGQVLTSADGGSWTAGSSATLPSWLEGAAWSDVGYVAVGANGVIETSADGSFWVGAAGGTTATIHGLAWSGTLLTPAGNPVTQLSTLANVPLITTQPVSGGTVNTGGTAVFTVAASGSGVTYQWRRNGTALTGATAATLTLSNVQPADAGTYTVTVATAAGSVTSNAVTLAVVPLLTAQTQWQKVFSGNSATFTVTASGATGYQWERSTDGANWTVLSDGGSFAGVTTATLTVSGVNAGMSGWRFRAVVAGAGGNVTTAPVTLTAITTTPSFLWGGLTGTVPLLPVLSPKAISGGVASVAAGGSNTMFIKTDGTLWATGNNQYGQYGNGTTSSTPQSTPVQIATGVAAVSASGITTLVLMTNGNLLGMGVDIYGQGSQNSSPSLIATGVASLSARAPRMFVKADGTLWARGYNFEGQLGDGSTTYRNTPVQIASGVAMVATGNYHTMFVKTDGTLWGAGMNLYGQLGDGSTTQRNTPVQIATGVASVAAGGLHTLFVKTDGTLWAIGTNGSGQLGDGSTVQRNTPVPITTGVASVMAGDNHTLFRKTDGTLWAMGTNGSGQLGDGSTTYRNAPVQIATGVAAMAAGENHTVFVKTDGSLWAHGSNDWGQLGDRQETPQAAPIASAVVGVGADSPSNNLFVKSDGTLWQHVNGQVSQVAGVSGVIQAIAGDGGQRRLYLKGDGTLWLLAENGTSSQVASGVVSAGAGFSYFAYLLSDGTLWGQGGDGSSIQFGGGTTPLQIADQVGSFSTAGWHLLLVKNNQTLWGMGTVWSGFAPGFGWTQYVTAPAQLDTGIVSAVASPSQNLYLKTDGTLWTRGSGWADSAGPAALVDSAVVSAATGLNRTLYIKADGILRSRTGIQGTLGATAQLAGGVGSVFGGAFDVTGWYMYLQATGAGTAPAITTQPQPDTIVTGTPITLQVAATGSAPMAYQWFKDGVAVPWAQAAQYPIPYATAGDAGSYTVTITNSDGSVTASAAMLALAPGITTHPQTQSAEVGGNVTFTVVATGTPAPTFQWRKDGVDIGGATGSSLTLSNLQLSHAGSYTVVVTNVASSVTSNPAVLTVGASFTAWQQSKFTTGEQADANISGPIVVYGLDGLPNLVKYALGLEPKQNITTGLPTVSTTASDWVYTYTRPSDRIDVTYTVEVSVDLVNWSATGVTHELVSVSGGIETWRARYPLASAAKVFFRLKVMGQ